MTRRTLVDPQTVKLLYEIGLSAASRGFGDETKPIFDTFALCFPDHAGAAIGYAMIAMSKDDFDGAITILRRDGVTKAVCSYEAKGLLAVALNMAGRTAEAQDLQRELSGYGQGQGSGSNRPAGTQDWAAGF